MPPVGPHVLQTTPPTGKGLPLLFSAGERQELEESVPWIRWRRKQSWQQGAHAFIWFFSLNRGGEKRNLRGVLAFISVSFLFTLFPYLYRNRLSLSE